MSRILSAVFFALAGVSIPPSCSSRGGGLPVVLVEAFAPATTPSRHQRSNSHYHHHGQIRPIPIGPKILSAFSKEQQQKLSLFTSTSTSLGSAKVLPFLYTGFSGALLYKAVALGTRPRMDSIVLLAFSALTFFNLGPSDNAKLGSGKLACKQTAATEEDDQHQQLLREKAATWRKSVRIKIIVQIVGLFRMVLAKQTEGLMRGAAMILGASILYISSGGGEARHDDDGNWKPMPEKAITGVLVIDAILCGAALVAAASSLVDGAVPPVRFAVAAWTLTAGVTVGTLEGIPQFVKALKGSKGTK